MLSVSDKVAIAEALDSLGLPQLQVGFPTARDLDVVRRLRARDIQADIEVLVPAFVTGSYDAMAHALDAGATALQILMRASDAILREMGLSRSSAMQLTLDTFSRAKELGAPITTLACSFSLQADLGFLDDLVTSALAQGATRVMLADTTGRGLPDDMARLVRHIAQLTRAPIGVHCHDDLGLATASTLAGLEAGASWAEVSVLGFGERSGNASLEQVVAARYVSYGQEWPLDLSRLTETCQAVAAILGREIPPKSPVVGAEAFTHRLGIHVELAERDPQAMEPFAPELVGNRRTMEPWAGQ